MANPSQVSSVGSAQEPLQIDKEEPVFESKYPLSCGTMLTYCSLKLAFSSFDYTVRPARFATYIEGLGMKTSTQATLIAVSKSFDLFAGFAVGKWSDDLRTRFGRRKPFLALALPIGILCYVLFCAPTLTFFRRMDVEQQPCSHLLPNVTTGCDAEQTEALRACLVDAFGITDESPSGTIPVLPEDATVPTDLFLLASYFGILYAGIYVFIWSSTNIPYDALGMELTDDSDRRALMFGVRGLFQLAGYIIPTVLQIVVAGYFPDDVPRQYGVMSMAFGAFGLCAMIAILLFVPERPVAEPTKKEESVVPIVPTFRRLMNNGPYLKYLLMRVPLTIVALLPTNFALIYIKFVLAREQYTAFNATVSIGGIGGAILGVWPSLYLAKRYGRVPVLLGMTVAMVVIWTGLFLAPGSFMNDHIWLMYTQSFLVGISWSTFFMLPDAMLADIIDYDELVTGTRSEATYTVIEAQLGQSVEIVGGVLPLLLLQMLEYANNGGCQCGCGTSCSALGVPYGRWVCPGDVAFTCDGAFSSPLMFGDPNRPAPCATQTDLVQWGIKFFYVGLPLLCGLIGMIPMSQYPISAAVHREIQREVQKRKDDPSYVCTDPLTGEKARSMDNTEGGHFREHFSAWERRAAAGAADVLAKLKSLVTSQLVGSIVVLVLAVATMYFANDDSIRAMGFLFLAIMALAIVWQALRLKALQQPPDGAAASLVRRASSAELVTGA